VEVMLSQLSLTEAEAKGVIEQVLKGRRQCHKRMNQNNVETTKAVYLPMPLCSSRWLEVEEEMDLGRIWRKKNKISKMDLQSQKINNLHLGHS
jgi:hypothetical protein